MTVTKRLFSYSTIVAILILFTSAGPANAGRVYPGTYVDMYLDDFPPGLQESKIFLDKMEGNTTTGNVGSQNGLPEVVFSSTTDTLISANGFATMEASDGTLNNLKITVPGYRFEDLIFDILIPPNQGGNNFDLSVTGTDQSGVSETYSGWNLSNGNSNNILVLSTTGNLMKSVTINSKIGIKQIKHFQVSGLTPVPLPGAVWLLGSGLVCIIGFRRRFKK